MKPLDVQNRRIENGFKLTRVGITGVKKPVVVHRQGRDNHLTAEIDVFVDLPSTQKGSHMSRNVEIITEMIDESVRKKVASLEELAGKICRKLLDRHEYAGFAEVSMTADYFLERTTEGGRRTLEQFKLMARATARRGNGTMKQVGVRVEGMTACPCAMETVQNRLEGEFPAVKKLAGSVPMISHNQRNMTTVMVEVPEHVEVEADDLVDIVEGALSSPTYGILKRDDEASVVLRAHRNPKFVEDVVRDILGKLLVKYDKLDDSVHVTVRSESEESIHKHNAFAERVTTLGELRASEER
ncbi:MAG: GTP cyclohydrolase MptA [Thermoplasmata archaeon]|jgi:GTP cyclohydrolase-4|nr:GTP cyclohydrolase MptA [Thermoplasmata archaeon]